MIIKVDDDQIILINKNICSNMNSSGDDDGSYVNYKDNRNSCRNINDGGGLKIYAHYYDY